MGLSSNTDVLHLGLNSSFYPILIYVLYISACAAICSFLYVSSYFPPFPYFHLLPFAFSTFFSCKINLHSHWRMEARSEGSLAFSVKVFTLQEAVRIDEHTETREVTVDTATLTYTHTVLVIYAVLHCQRWIWISSNALSSSQCPNK